MSDLNPQTSLFSHSQFPSLSLKNMTQMSESKDPVIKLFGKTIHLPVQNRDRDDLEADKETSVNTPPTPENCAAQDATARIDDTRKTHSFDNETATFNSSRTKDDHSDTSVSEEEKSLKKPDKIIPCPRCNSMDTKFCYYNNYNVRQPRHFCKKCQRYWTAGGTMRNVPMGAGRRQNKSSVSHFRHLDVSEPIRQRAQRDVSIGIHHSPTFRPNGVVNAPASSLCKSVELKLATTNFNPSVPIPALRPSAYPMPFDPAATWNIPYTPNLFSHKHQIHCHPKSSLGKRSSDDDDLVQASNTFEKDTCERRLWIPKTLRIDDPKEAAKSSIWETLGITNETGDSMEGRGLFKAFQSKGHEKNHILKKCNVLNANPVAMCRSLNFHESS